MTEKSYDTPCGSIHYWVSRAVEKAYTLVFLPGLTADHRLFERQLAYFAPRCPVLVWDAPGHGRSWPFRLDFTLMEKARWLEEILQREALPPPVLVGQSMGDMWLRLLCSSSLAGRRALSPLIRLRCSGSMSPGQSCIFCSGWSQSIAGILGRCWFGPAAWGVRSLRMVRS